MGDSYGKLDKVLHRLALGTDIIPEMCFDLEQAIYSSKSETVDNSHHVFVAGLARAGTTILMREIFQARVFHSLTYRDMPFILSTNLWRIFSQYSMKNMELQRRAHDDGLLVNFDSPEALDEVFWRVFAGERYISSDGLLPMTATDREIILFRKYVASLLRNTNATRYLSKNTNNILRLSSITRAFPNSTILVPFRNPIQQAYSLLRQHKRFLVIHSQDNFALKYMNWLVHHEFGENHRRFLVGNRVDHVYTQLNINYWILLWINVYGFLKENLPRNALLVCYEKLCDGSISLWNDLLSRLELAIPTSSPKFLLSNCSVKNDIDPELKRIALLLYGELEEKGRESL